MMHAEKLSSMITFLNDLLTYDRDAVAALIESRVPCNSALMDHPTVQVSFEGQVGLLGILNGYVGVRPNGVGYVAAVYEDDGTLVRFEETKG